MAETNDEIAHEFRFFRVYKDGRVVILATSTEKIAAFEDPITGVRSKDAIVSTEPPVSVRIFLPRITDPSRKLPLLVYIHGGGFCIESAFSRLYHNYVATVVEEANVIAVSVEYGLFPDRPIPACYKDSWAALQWVASHSGRSGPEPWLNDHADFERVFVSGDSAGGNISHNVVSQAGAVRLSGVRIIGMVLAHPFFGGTEDDEMWLYMNPENEGKEDRRLKPAGEVLKRLGCERALVFAAEKDHLFEAGKNYVRELKKSGWGGEAELVANLGQGHVFHLENPRAEGEALNMLQKIVSFINQR